MRYLLLWVGAAILLGSAAVNADEGAAYKGRFTVTMDLSDEFFKLAAKQAEPGAELDADSFAMEPVSGLIYLTRDAVRMDMNVPGGVLSSIVRPHDGVMYLVNHAGRTAWEVDLTAYTKQYEDMGLPMLNPEEVFLHWEDVLAQMRALPGLKCKDLGSKKVNGLACHGLQFSGRIEDVLKWGEVELVPQLKPLKDLSGPWSGEYWIAEDSGLPIKMHSRMFGVDWRWEITEIAAWEANPVLFLVPHGYSVEPFDVTLPELPAAAS